ncbi:MAG: hypothetical protein MK052_09375 [Alphaproteobacteria bacterium]|nr:hypothetical protein [Alphaproteobacteria bacterium]
MKFQNPQNGYTEEVTDYRLWAFLFGPLYFAYKGVWHMFLVAAVVQSIAFVVNPGIWILTCAGVAALAGGEIRKGYLKKGWSEVADDAKDAPYWTQKRIVIAVALLVGTVLIAVYWAKAYTSSFM